MTSVPGRIRFTTRAQSSAKGEAILYLDQSSGKVRVRKQGSDVAIEDEQAILTRVGALAKGKIIVSTASSWSGLAVGTNNQVLTADSTTTEGIKWAAAGGGDSVTVNAAAVTDADLDDATPASPARGLNVKWQAAGASPTDVSAYVPWPTTTKGDLLVDSGTNVIRQAVGVDGTLLLADASQTAGVKWRIPQVYRGRWLICDEATLRGIGCTNPTLGGTVADVSDATGPAIRCRTAASVGAGAGFGQTANNHFRRGWKPVVEWRVRTGPSLASVRVWVLLASASLTNSDTMAGNGIGFRYSTVAGDTGWVGCARDGTTQSVSAQIAAIAVDTEYLLRMRCDGTSWYLSVDEGSETTISSNVPGDVGLGWELRVYTQEAVAKDVILRGTGGTWP